MCECGKTGVFLYRFLRKHYEQGVSVSRHIKTKGAWQCTVWPTISSLLYWAVIVNDSVMAALHVLRLLIAIYSIQVFASTKSVKLDLESGEIAHGKPIIATSTCEAFETYCYVRGKRVEIFSNVKRKALRQRILVLAQYNEWLILVYFMAYNIISYVSRNNRQHSRIGLCQFICLNGLPSLSHIVSRLGIWM